MILVAMEEEDREHFQVGAVENTQGGCRKRLITAVSTDGKVFFKLLLTAEIEEVHAETVLDMLFSMWITICGFSFAIIYNKYNTIAGIFPGSPHG